MIFKKINLAIYIYFGDTLRNLYKKYFISDKKQKCINLNIWR